MLVREEVPELDADCVPDDETVPEWEVDCDWDPLLDNVALFELEADFKGVLVGVADISKRQTNCLGVVHDADLKLIPPVATKQSCDALRDSNVPGNGAVPHAVPIEVNTPS